MDPGIKYFILRQLEHLPAGVIAMDGARELSFGSIPLFRWLEGNVGSSVVDNGESACNKKYTP